MTKYSHADLKTALGCMVNSPLVSIIVPVYNVDEWIEECLCSIQNQSFKDYEVIMIDDGSTDGSANICLSYSSLDSKFIYYKQENQGLGAARNYGVKKANGAYITFIDSDDYVTVNYLEKFVEKLSNSNVDIVSCMFQRMSESGELGDIQDNFLNAIKPSINGRELSNCEKILGLYSSSMSCARIYRTSFLKEYKLKFPEKIPHEDWFFTYKSFYLAREVDYISLPLYKWRIRDGSLSLSITKLHIDAFFLLIKDTDNFLDDIKADGILRLVANRRNIMLMNQIYWRSNKSGGALENYFIQLAAAYESYFLKNYTSLDEGSIDKGVLKSSKEILNMIAAKNLVINDSAIKSILAENKPLLPLLHIAMSRNLELALEICRVGLDRSRSNKTLESIYKSKLTEIQSKISLLEKRVDIANINDDTLIILGNGPSLKDIMLNPYYLNILKKSKTFGLNAAYRAYERFDFYPNYFGSFDYEVNESHCIAYEDLVLNCNKIEKFFFAKNHIFSNKVRDHKRFQKINFIPAPTGVSNQLNMSVSFDEFHDLGSSGTNAVQAGYVLGYRKFLLLGCDCKYVEILDGIEVKNEVRYQLTKDLDVNPNYWFDDYQKAGDKFNKPNTDSIQYVAWQKLKELELRDKFLIANGSYPTSLKLFDKIPFGIYSKKFKNVFLVMSCAVNVERINTVKKQFQNYASSDDLFLFVIGGADHDGIGEDSILSLNCGDLYENLPHKVYSAVRFCFKNLNFDRIVKVDDDVYINFNNFYQIVDENFSYSYYGRRNPPVFGMELNEKYHFGRVSEGHKYHNKEFPLPKNIQWNSGGMYILDKAAASIISGYKDIEWIKSHLYEDVMIYTILSQFNIKPVHHETSKDSSLVWMRPTVEGVLNNNLSNVEDDFSYSSVVSVHCGASKSRNLQNSEIWNAFQIMDYKFSDLSSMNRNFNLNFDFDAEKIIFGWSFNRDVSFYLNKIVYSNSDFYLLTSEAGEVVAKKYERSSWVQLIRNSESSITVFIVDFDIQHYIRLAIPNSIPTSDVLQPGLSFILRAKNEVKNIEFVLCSLKEILNDSSLNCELIFIDNNSSDGTFEEVINVTRRNGIKNIGLYRYDVNISRSGDEHANLAEKGEMSRSLDTYYNWCLDRASKFNIIKWDADFLAITDNLRSMILHYKIPTTNSPLAIWCTGKTLFRKGNDSYVNMNTMYNEFRLFSKLQGYRWEYAPRWEICSQEYMVRAEKHIYAPCVFLELKDLSRNEFEFRSNGVAIVTDVRDKRDLEIISFINSNDHSNPPVGLNTLSFNPLLLDSSTSKDLLSFEASNEELDGLQTYWLNVYSKPNSNFWFKNKGNSVIQGLWVGDSITDLHRLCVESFIKNGHCFVLYTYGSVSNLPDGVVIKDARKIIPENLIYQYGGSYAGFSDLFRNKLLYVHGGWYVDLDIFCLKPFDVNAEMVFSMDYYDPDNALAKRGGNEIIDDKYYVATNPCKLPARHEVSKSMYSLIFKKIIFDKLKVLWLGDSPDAPTSWLKGELSKDVILNRINMYDCVSDFQFFIGSFDRIPDKASFHKLLEIYDVAFSDVGQKTWGEIGPNITTREVISRKLEAYATRPEAFQGIIKYFEVDKYLDVNFDFNSILKSENPYSLDLFFTMWRRRGLLEKFDTQEACLLKHMKELVASSKQ